MAIKNIAVIGAGAMGNGIAKVSATSGYAVTIIDVSTDALKRAQATIAASVDKLHGKGKLTDEARDNALHGIQTETALSAAANADLVIEAATENKPLKLKIFADLHGIAKPVVILAPNTSSISITEIAAAPKRRENAVGGRSLSPAPT